MKYLKFTFLILIFYSFFTSCKKDATKCYYSGTLYDKDGVTPMANEQLTLKGSSNSPYNYSSGTVGSLVTNSDGSFKFEFGENEYTHFSVISPKGGLLLTHGNTDKNYSRDLCIERKALVTVIVNLQRELNEEDTLFFFGPPPQSTLKGSNVSIYPHLKKSFVLDKVGHAWNGEGLEYRAFRWGIGWEEFRVCYENYEDKTEAYLKEHCFRYTIHGFPYVDTVEVTIR